MGENGILEAVNTLKKQVEKLFDTTRDVELHGSALAKHNAEAISALRKEFEFMERKIDKLKTQQNYWNGGIAALIVLVPILIKLFW